MADAEFFRRQGARCLRLSRTSFDMETSRQLRLMAAEFMERAASIEAARDCLPCARGSGDSEGGNAERN